MRLTFPLFAKATSLLAALAALGATRPLDQIAIGRDIRTILEQRVPLPIAIDWAEVRGIVVAGGSKFRLQEALRLARLHPHLHIVLTGPGADEIELARRETDVAPSRIHIEERARNTFENALYSKHLVQPGTDDVWLLATSAAHMPRAAGSFWRVGFPVKPWPVYDRIADPSRDWHVARHEVVGLLFYWLMGRTSALFPAALDGREHAPQPWTSTLIGRAEAAPRG